MGCKAEVTTRSINNALGPWMTDERTVQWWFQKFCKGDKSLEDEKHSGQSLEVDNNQLRAITEADSFTPIWETADELNVDHSNVIWHLKQIGKVKKLDKRVPHELTENQKKSLFWSVVFFYSTQQAISQIVTCDEKWILYDNQQRQWLDWEEAPKHFPKPNMHLKQVMVTGGLLLVWPTTAFWISAKDHIWEVCSANWWDAPKTAMPAASTGQKNRPILLHDNAQLHGTQPTLQNLKTNSWATKFGLNHHIHLTSCQPTTISSSISTTFCRGNTSTTSKMQKMLSKSSLNPEAWIFMLQEQTNLFLFAKCVDCNGSCFD